MQCHFGQDTLSFARMGSVATGIDFSEKAIEKAKELNKQLNLNAQFVCCDVYEAPNVIDEKFDIVFTSYGTIGWLPDLDKWAKVVSHFLKPKGMFIMAEFHPVVWMFDHNFKEVFYSYFNSKPILEEESGTYANKDSRIKTQTITWNHPISEVFNALISNQIAIDVFNEYDYSPYNCFNNTEEFESEKYRIKHLENKIPMVFALKGTKK